MRIKNHKKSHVVELEDGSRWRIWPGDLAVTLQWLPTSNLEVAEIDHEVCSHALIDRDSGARVRAIEASEAWPVEQVRRSLRSG